MTAPFRFRFRYCLTVFVGAAVLVLPATGRAQSLSSRLKNIKAGTAGSAPDQFTEMEVGGKTVVFFSADDGPDGIALWQSDGTTAGTTLFKDGNNKPVTAPSNLHVVKITGVDTLFFSATDSSHGRELWKSDGTAGGTGIVTDIRSGSGDSNPSNFLTATLQGKPVLVFTADDGMSGTELWSSDGTPLGTTRIADIQPGLGGSISGYVGLTAMTVGGSDEVFFVADDGTHGRELWHTNGTALGTSIVADLNPAGGSDPTALTVFPVAGADRLFFSAKPDGVHAALCSSDGTEAGTAIVPDADGHQIADPTEMAVLDNGVAELLFFAATDSVAGAEIWRSDGIAPPELVADINQKPGTGSNPSHLTPGDSILYFVADDGSLGPELWQTDGTEPGTNVVADINNGNGGSSPENLTPVGSTLFFTANDGLHGIELWKTDGTDTGTVRVTDINPQAASSTPGGLLNVRGTLFFAAQDAVAGREPWIFLAGCGDGGVSPGEQCDDGNVANGDCCSSSCRFEAAATPCDDHSACTKNDTCDGAGACRGTTITCAALDQCHDVGTCDPTSGCSNPPFQNGHVCDDKNKCTTGDACADGICVGSAIVCAPLDQCHEGGSCDPQTGICSTPFKRKGSPCSDGNVCTQIDTCDGAGACVGDPTSIPTCDDGNPCTEDTCVSPGGCQHVPGHKGAPCRDPVCTGAGCCDVADTCDGISAQCIDQKVQSGTACQDDGNPCTADICDGVNNTCQHLAAHPGAACADDGNPCTADKCDGISVNCQHPPGNENAACADDGNPCTVDQCDGTHSDCQHRAGNAKASCPDDGNPCTTDECDGSSTQCQHAPGNKGAPCRESVCSGAGCCDVADTCDGSSAQCIDQKIKSGTACQDDNNHCTADICDGINNTCQHPAANPGVACADDGNPCTADKCDGITVNCQHPPGNPNAACADDGNPCTVDRCDGSHSDCQHPAGNANAICPDDGNPCTADQCDGHSSQCQHFPSQDKLGVICHASVCDATTDKSCCDLPDTCDGKTANCPDAKLTGSCADDGNVCTDDICDGVNSRCQHPAGHAGVACADDGNPCTTDVCDGVNTACQHHAGNASSPCTDDGNPCTEDKCDGTHSDCQHPVGHAGTACADDGNPCTVDQCDGTHASCQHLAGNTGTACRASVCPAGDPACCDVADVCDGISTVCPDKKRSGSCQDDGNPCTQDVCDGVNNLCQHPPGNKDASCQDDGNPCTVDLCDGATGLCQHPAGNAGVSCADDGNPCTVDVCDGVHTACQHVAGNAGASCGPAACDVNSPGCCDLPDTCDGISPVCRDKKKTGACVDDGNPCTIDTCDGVNSLCQHIPGNQGATCPDDGNPCTADVCDGANALCQHPPGNSGAACADDGNPCTVDRCDGSTSICKHTAGNAGASCGAVFCNPADPSCCDLPDTCDGISTTCVDRKKTGDCPAAADDGNPCTKDVCDGVNNLCQHPAGHAGTACPDDGNVCTVDTCDGAHVECQHVPGNVGKVCREAACDPNTPGCCDIADTCDGLSATCSDKKKPANTACADDGNECTKDICDGVSTFCQHPAANAGSSCSSDGNACTVDACDGVHPDCQHSPGNAGTACADDNNPCTVDLCDGVHSDCQHSVDSSTAGKPCPDDNNPCTTDLCDGVHAACQHNPGNAGATCGAAKCDVNSPECCDLIDVCDGSTPNCPDKRRTGSCPDDGNPCTLDVCDGAHDVCQHPPGNKGAVCRREACDDLPLKAKDPLCCDVAEVCSGASALCPEDSFKQPVNPDGVPNTCRAQSGVCDVAELCSGHTPICPADDVVKPTLDDGSANPAAVCRPAVGDCDRADVCDGATKECPPDAKIKSTDPDGVCRPTFAGLRCGATGVTCAEENTGLNLSEAFGPSSFSASCDVKESCDGMHDSCPSDVKCEPGTPCLGRDSTDADGAFGIRCQFSPDPLVDTSECLGIGVGATDFHEAETALDQANLSAVGAFRAERGQHRKAAVIKYTRALNFTKFALRKIHVAGAFDQILPACHDEYTRFLRRTVVKLCESLKRTKRGKLPMICDGKGL